MATTHGVGHQAYRHRIGIFQIGFRPAINIHDFRTFPVCAIIENMLGQRVLTGIGQRLAQACQIVSQHLVQFVYFPFQRAGGCDKFGIHHGTFFHRVKMSDHILGLCQ